MPGDGACLFHALAEGWPGGDAAELREAVCDYIAQDTSFAEHHFDGGKEKYVREMRKPDEHGDEMAVMAAARMTRRHIWLLNAENPNTMTCYSGNYGTCQSYTGITYRKFHYDLLDMPPGVTLLTQGNGQLATSVLQSTRRTARNETSRQQSDRAPTERRAGPKPRSKKTRAKISAEANVSKPQDKNMGPAGWTDGKGDWLIRSANINSWHQKSDMVLGWKANAVALQETRLTDQGQRDATNEAYDRGWKALWGAPVSLKASGVSVNGGKHSGVGLLVQRRVPAQIVQTGTAEAKQLWNSGRFLHAKVITGVGRQWLHIFVWYGFASGKRKVLLNQEHVTLMLREVAALGNVPVVMLGDWNCAPQPQKCIALQTACAAGELYDAALDVAMRNEAEPESTYFERLRDRKAKSRLDAVFVNRNAVVALDRCTVANGVALRPHKPIDTTFRFEAYRQKVQKFVTPQCFSFAKISEDQRLEAEEMAEKQRTTDTGTTDEMWHSWSADAQTICSYLCADGCEQQSRCQGKGEIPERKEMWLSGLQKGREDGEATPLLRKLSKLAQQVQAIRSQLKRHACYDQGARNSLEKLRPRVTEVLGWVLPDIVDEGMLEEVGMQCRSRREAEKDRLARQRGAEAAERTRVQWAREPGSIFAKVRKPAVKAEGVVSLQQGDSACMDDVHSSMLESWLPIFRKFSTGQEPSYEEFKARYGRYIPYLPHEVAPVTPEMLLNNLRLSKKGKSAGLDGWFTTELLQLPAASLNRLSEILNRIEDNGEWPEALLSAAVPMIPKEKVPGPLEHRPITVMSAVYRLWSGTRSRQLQDWQEGWIGDNLHGFRPKHGADDAYRKTALVIERALLTGKPIHGVLLDIKKCFDSIPWSIAFGLLEDMGLDKKVTRPLQHMYLNLKRHMKIHGTAGEDFQATNGILQGCALSVIVLNAVVAVWDKVMREEAKVETDAYADDTKFLSADPEKLRVGIGVTEEFGRRTSLEYTKVHAFSTKRGRHKPVITMGGKKLEMKESFRDVGAEINTVLMQNPRVDGQATRRCKKTFDILDRIAFLPGATDACRSSLVMSMIMPMALYGTETANPQHEALRTLTRKCVGALQGGRVEFCGRRYRCSAVVTNVLYPGHRADPICAMVYQRILAMERALHSAGLGPLVREVHKLSMAANRRRTIAGPVTLLQQSCKQKGWTWATPGKIIAERGQVILLKRSEEEKKKRSPGKLQHDAREALRCHTWKYAEKNRLVGHFDRGEDKQIPRRDMQGIGAGVEYRIVTSIVDAEKDPYRRTLMRSIIAGAILTEERLYREKTRKLPGPAPTSAEEREGPYAGKCTTCGEGVETMEHLWWQCSRYSDIRAERRYLDVVLLSRDDWPACMGCGLLPIGLKLHSLLGNKELMESLLSMYVDIVIRRMDVQLQREEKEAAKVENRGYPWGWSPNGEMQRAGEGIEDEPPEKWRPNNKGSVENVVLYMALVWYSKNLIWPVQQPKGINGTSWLELAIDFETATGVRMINMAGGPTTTAKGKAQAFQAACIHIRNLHPLVVHFHRGSRRDNVNSLLALGIGEGVAGVNRRCIFLGGKRTEDVLRKMQRERREKARPKVLAGGATVPFAGADDETLERLLGFQQRAEHTCEERKKQYKCPDNLDKGQVLFFDGGARGNGTTEGPSGSGAVEKREGRITWQADRRLPSGTSNNVAEYVALLLALDRVLQGPTLEQSRTQVDDDDGQVKDGRKGRKSRDSRAVRIFGDSSLALNQVTGRWACNKRLWPYCQAAQDKVRQIRSEGRVVTLRHVRRCFNKEADSLSNVAMDRPEEEADLRLLLSESGGTAASTQSTTDGNAVLRPSMAPS